MQQIWIYQKILSKEFYRLQTMNPLWSCFMCQNHCEKSPVSICFITDGAWLPKRLQLQKTMCTWCWVKGSKLPLLSGSCRRFLLWVCLLHVRYCLFNIVDSSLLLSISLWIFIYIRRMTFTISFVTDSLLFVCHFWNSSHMITSNPKDCFQTWLERACSAGLHSLISFLISSKDTRRTLSCVVAMETILCRNYLLMVHGAYSVLCSFLRAP